MKRLSIIKLNRKKSYRSGSQNIDGDQLILESNSSKFKPNKKRLSANNLSEDESPLNTEGHIKFQSKGSGISEALYETSSINDDKISSPIYSKITKESDKSPRKRHVLPKQKKNEFFPAIQKEVKKVEESHKFIFHELLRYHPNIRLEKKLLNIEKELNSTNNHSEINNDSFSKASLLKTSNLNPIKKQLKPGLLSKIVLKMKSKKEENINSNYEEPPKVIDAPYTEHEQSLPQLSIVDFKHDANDKFFSLMNKRISKYEKSKSRSKNLKESSSKLTVPKLKNSRYKLNISKENDLKQRYSVIK